MGCRETRHPTGFESYEENFTRDIIYERAIIKNKDEDENFRVKYQNKKIRIVKLTTEELSQFNILIRILYKATPWHYIIATIIISCLIYVISIYQNKSQ